MTKKHGGKRPNSGRPPLKDKRVKVAITMTQEHYKKTSKVNRSQAVEQGLNLLYN